jgi:MoaA/NifB/PqqE/SkfB family radical SAM enzyme
MAFSVNSNLVYNLDTIEQLADLRPELLITSLDAAEGPHTAARGPGYCQTVQNIKWLRAAGVPVRLNCTLSRATLPYLESFIDEFAPLGCGFCFILTRPTGRAVSAFNPPPLDDLIAAVSRIEARRLDYPDVYVSTSFAVVMDHEVSIGGINLTGCNAVQKSFNINSDGTISPCAFLFELSPDAYSLGNLREEDYSVLRVWRESQLLGQLRHKSYQANRRCITCSHFKKDCLGTCVFMTCYRERTGQVDPYCRESIATGCHCCRQFGTGASDTLNGSSL